MKYLVYCIALCYALAGRAQTPTMRFVEVEGEATLEYVPTHIKYRVTINSVDVIGNQSEDLYAPENAHLLQKQLEEITEERYLKVWAILKAEGVPESAIQRWQSPDFSIVSSGNTALPRILLLHFDNFDRFKKVVSKLQASETCEGTLESFAPADSSALEAQVMRLAVEKARWRATILAEACGASVGIPIEITDCSDPSISSDLLTNWYPYLSNPAETPRRFYTIGASQRFEKSKKVRIKYELR